jgi:two-component system KDP operon response regulator KdpE
MNQPGIHTLLVTLDQEWSLSLYGHLVQNGFAPVTRARTGDSALSLLYDTSPRLVLVDLHLPDCNGIDLCTEILLARPAAKIVLVAESGAEAPLAALRAGISGCIDRAFPLAAWPGLLLYVLNGGMVFSQGVIEAALLAGGSAQKHEPPLLIGALWIDLAQRQVFYAGQRVLLTPREFALLTYLARNQDQVVTVDQLLNEAWGYDANDGTPAQVRLYIARLRRKLLDEAQTPDFILTERGVGYRLHSETLHRAQARAHRYRFPPLQTPLPAHP